MSPIFMNVYRIVPLYILKMLVKYWLHILTSSIRAPGLKLSFLRFLIFWFFGALCLVLDCVQGIFEIFPGWGYGISYIRVCVWSRGYFLSSRDCFLSLLFALFAFQRICLLLLVLADSLVNRMVWESFISTYVLVESEVA